MNEHKKSKKHKKNEKEFAKNRKEGGEGSELSMFRSISHNTDTQEGDANSVQDNNNLLGELKIESAGDNAQSTKLSVEENSQA